MDWNIMLTKELQSFLSLPESKRDYSKGAYLLLRITGNIIRYREMERKGFVTFKEFINKKLREQADYRLSKLTHSQVRSLRQKAEKIVVDSPSVEKDIRNGKRKDHNSLPENIQACYVEALSCLQKERELNTQIRLIVFGKYSCPDSELYPFVKEIVKLDDKRLKLWKEYDEYKA